MRSGRPPDSEVGFESRRLDEPEHPIVAQPLPSASPHPAWTAPWPRRDWGVGRHPGSARSGPDTWSTGRSTR